MTAGNPAGGSPSAWPHQRTLPSCLLEGNGSNTGPLRAAPQPRAQPHSSPMVQQPSTLQRPFPPCSKIGGGGSLPAQRVTQPTQATVARTQRVPRSLFPTSGKGFPGRMSPTKTEAQTFRYLVSSKNKQPLWPTAGCASAGTRRGESGVGCTKCD